MTQSSRLYVVKKGKTHYWLPFKFFKIKSFDPDLKKQEFILKCSSEFQNYQMDLLVIKETDLRHLEPIYISSENYL